MKDTFRLGLTSDFLNAQGDIGWGDIGLSLLDERSDISWDFLPPADGGVISADTADKYDALLVLTPRVTAETVEGAQRLSLVARFGVGYDSVDVEACTSAGVALTITPDGIRRPVATAALTLLLASSHKLLIKDRLTRAGRWNDKLDHMGTGVTGKTLGLVGLGNIGRETVALAQAFSLNCLAYDPYASPEVARSLGVELVKLPELMSRSDFVCVTAVLTPETHHLIDGAALDCMKPTAHLINVGRGPIVDQSALVQRLEGGHIAGAALDVFEDEPISPDDPILSLDNVIVTPHGIAWTDETAWGNGTSALQAVMDVAAGRTPKNVVNRGVLDQESFLSRLRRHRDSGESEANQS